MKTSFRFGALVCALVLASIVSVFAQGSLTPPGPPAPTMKSLDQIASTGIAINATNTPGDSNYTYIISTAGSYYLGSNLHVSGTNGIHVTAAGVTIDLNGFQIDRASGSGGDGITIDVAAHRCTVKNGSITGFAYGVDCSGTTVNGGAFIGLAVSGCSSYGLLGGNGWRIEGCQAHDENGFGIVARSGSALANCTVLNDTGTFSISVGDGSTLINCATSSIGGSIGLISTGNRCTLMNCTTFRGGISVGFNCALMNCSASNSSAIGITTADYCVLTNCSAFGNGTFGISVANACTLANCTGSGNTSAAPVSAGITVGNNCSLNNCSASNNATTNPTHTDSTGAGFTLGSSNTMHGCSASYNDGDGISFGTDCVIAGNNATGNGSHGFHTLGSLNRIDSNTADGNTHVGFLWNNDYVVRNTAFVNSGGNYNPATGGNFGPIEAASTSTHPWANF